MNYNKINTISIDSTNFLTMNNPRDFVQVSLQSKLGNANLLVLVDTGALHGDYISLEVEKIALRLGFNSMDSDVMVCTAISNESQCTPAKNAMILPVIFKNELNNLESSFESKFTVIKTDYDMIIGRQSIKKYDLTSWMHG